MKGLNMTYPMSKYLFQANKNDSTAICKCDLLVFLLLTVKNYLLNG